VVHFRVDLKYTPSLVITTIMTTPTRQRLVDSAIKRFYRDGFRNVGIDQILTDVGISKTAFYKHFECKDDLMIAALEMQNDWLQETFRSMIREHGGEAPIARLHAVFDVVDMILESDDFQGCIFVNAAMEFPLPHDPAHRLALKNKQMIEEIVRELAVEAGAAEPHDLAQELCLIMEGAYVTRHVTGNKQTIDIARRVARLVIDGYCSPAETSSIPSP
jgi:AcrR family transcriptional regulator